MVYCLSGKIGSGKSSIAKALSKKNNIGYVSFSAYLKKLAESQGFDPNNRIVLQRIGEDLVNNDIKNFCRNVLNQIKWEGSKTSFVIDGLRHEEVFQILKELIPNKKLILIYIETDKNIRVQRLNLKSGLLDMYEKHSTEKQVENELKIKADLIIDGSKNLNQIVDDISAFIII